MCAVARGRCVGEGNVCFGVNGGEDVAFYPFALTYHRIKRQALQGLELNAFGFSGDGGARKALTLTSCVGLPSAGTKLVGGAGNHATNRAHAGKSETVLLAKRDELGEHFFFAQVWNALAQALEFSHDLWAPVRGSNVLGTFAHRFEGHSIAACKPQRFTPSVEGAFANAEGIDC